MQKLLSDDLWTEIAKAGKRRGCVAAIAYVTAEHVQFSRGDVLICDASDIAIASGETSAKVLRDAFNRGAQVYSLPSLHAKLMVFGELAVIGSANLSNSKLIEASVVTDDPTIVSQSKALIDRFARIATAINQRFLDHILAIEVTRRRRSGVRTARPINVTGGRTWIIRVDEITKDLSERESILVSRGERRAEKLLSNERNELVWIRFGRNSRFRKLVSEGDTVLQLWRAAGRKHPMVIPHSTVILRQDEPSCTRLYIEQTPKHESSSLTLADFQRMARRAGMTQRIGPTTMREISAETSALLKRFWQTT
jgi:hypothetical protein